MADTGKQSPLGVNSLSTLLNDTSLQINPVFAGYVGTSHTRPAYSFGSLVSDTCLRLLTWAINDGYCRKATCLTDATYENLIRIGVYPTLTVPALGNAKALTFTWDKSADPGAASIEQTYSWNPYTLLNPTPAVRDITSWGYVRLFALQGWDEFNYNYTLPEYRDFLSSFMMASSFTDYSNQAIMSVQNSKTFLDGTYSNMNDLMSADILGVNLATPVFGLDLIDLGKAVDLITIDSFGLPSKLLLTLQKFNAITASLSLALQSTELTYNEISFILSNTGTPTPTQEFYIYQAFTIIGNQDLTDILVPLNCKTQGLSTLADLLNVKLLFPRSYTSLTVPIYNTTQSNVNSKIYYPLYIGNAVNVNLSSPAVISAVGTVVSTAPPTIVTSVAPDVFSPQEPAVGFGSYLHNILPADIAIAAGAFSASMLQIRNIQSVPIEKFAQAVTNVETTTGLSVNGTSVPVNTSLANSAANKIALGSGPFGTYTTSNFFGCMSGLPYPVADIQKNILSAQTTKLVNIYHELYLAVEWEKAYCTITQTPSLENVQQYIPPTYDPLPPYSMTDPGQPRIDRLYYTVAISMGDTGGGYSRGTAPKPIVTLSPNHCGASVTLTQGTNDLLAGSVGAGTFGRIQFSISNGVRYQYDTVTNAVNNDPPDQTCFTGAHAPPMETIEVQAPPIATLAVIGAGTISTAGICVPGDVYNTNGLYAAGTVGWLGMNTVVQSYIDQANAEITYISDKSPTTTAQLNVLWNVTGAQLTLEQRARWTCFQPVPIPRNDYLSRFPTTHYSFIDSIPRWALRTEPHMYAQTLEAISDWTEIGGQSIVGMMRQERNQSVLSLSGIPLDNNIQPTISSLENSTLIANGTLPNAVTGAGININGVECTVPAYLAVVVPTTATTATNVVTPLPAGTYTPGDNTFTLFAPWPVTGGNTGDGDTGGIQSPVDTTPGDGYPGSLGGSEYVGVIPPNINTNFTSSQLIPSTVTPGAALGEIIINNCDCWS